MGRRPFSLAAYLAYARGRGGASAPVSAPPRPSGALLWLHAGGPGSGRALAALAARLLVQRPDLSLMVTGQPDHPPEGALPVPLPGETPAEVEAFCAHWHPQVCFWIGQDLRPALLQKMQDTGTKLVLLDARDAPWTSPAPSWVPDPAGATLQLFDRICPVDDPARRRLRRAGVEERAMPATGPITDSAPPLDCNAALYEEMAGVLTGRPVWLAARLRSAREAEEVLLAHKRAVRLAHRLLLILVPATYDLAPEIAEAARTSGLRLCAWEAGEMPDENTQVLVTEDASELGLWYRLAPVAFLGGSLVNGHGGEDPMEAAAHGTALLYGPNVGRHLPAYSRLAEAGAARIVRDFDSLGAALTQLVAPDRAAAMAHAGWDVITEGAELTDEMIALACGWFDETEHA
ncbi:3-deoxy-D-manno-octulosonic acid transferase [Salipiger sp. CCB-MM3]|uniref:3-deoxy-D-manno-octulosonic acid transferase n=1 Tax=Salipiger sp. CCB-MM3 TaxID=1792508 RepID=UPI00080AC1A5|nr:glycosyltransferase N-terminal domain-containing protein [Salipiger sp. CCB-MM3]ANT62043.1 3-deoxy-D-manno-octulosonic acid transferase [Salipiger sp. CCB-MM3]